MKVEPQLRSTVCWLPYSLLWWSLASQAWEPNSTLILQILRPNCRLQFSCSDFLQQFLGNVIWHKSADIATKRGDFLNISRRNKLASIRRDQKNCFNSRAHSLIQSSHLKFIIKIWKFGLFNLSFYFRLYSFIFF